MYQRVGRVRKGADASEKVTSVPSSHAWHECEHQPPEGNCEPALSHHPAGNSRLGYAEPSPRAQTLQPLPVLTHDVAV